MRAILIVKTSSMGDVIQYLPAITDLRAAFPHADIDWLVEAPFAPLARLHPGVREVLAVRIRTWRKQLLRAQTWKEIGALRRTLRERQYDLVLDAQGLIKSAMLARLANRPIDGLCPHSARERIASLFYDRRHAVSWDLHALDRNRALTAMACGYPLTTAADYGVPPPSLPGEALVPQQPYVMLFTATARDEKLWPEAHWIALGRMLGAQGLICLLPAGNEVERERATRIAAGIPGAELCPRMALDSLAAIIARAAGAVGVDTGLSHLAAALNVPITALYVATEPGANGVAGSARARNLGGMGQCPTPDEAFHSLTQLMRGGE